MATGVRAEIKQNQPFKSMEQEALVALLLTADVLQGKITDALKPYGISPTQYNALRILRGAGEEGLACTEVAERMINRDPDITRLMDRLERQKLAVRGRDRKDRRVINTRITDEGLELLKSVEAPLERQVRRLLGRLEGPQLEVLLQFLQQIRDQAAGLPQNKVLSRDQP